MLGAGCSRGIGGAGGTTDGCDAGAGTAGTGGGGAAFETTAAVGWADASSVAGKHVTV